MNKQRLLELAGIGSNMNNPSQEPYSEIPAASEDPTGAPGTEGFDELGDSGEMSAMERIREEAQRGADNPEEAQKCCETILMLIEPDEEMNDEREEI